MKKIAFYFLAAMLLGLYSCSKENEIEQDFNQTSSLKVQNDNGMDYKVVDGILHFETPDAFYNLSEYLMNMSEDEFEAWEIENDFISLQSELLDVNKSLDNCQTAEDFEKIITENSDIIAISEDRIVPVVDSDFYTRIANRRGYFVAEGYLQKITNSGLYFCKDLCFEEIEKAFNGIETEIVEHYNFDLKQELKSVCNCNE